jgi:hypothetical protein
MSRATKVLAGTTVLGFLTSIWLYLDNSSLREEVAAQAEAVAEASAPAKTGEDDAWLDAARRSGKIDFKNVTPAPKLPDGQKEHRLDRRVRRTEEFAALFGRLEGETEEQWKERVTPLIAAGLAKVRIRSNDNRRIAEEKAGVTPEQTKQIDQAMDKVYADLMDYTNKAVKDGQLSPYERNVAGWLDYAGGLGGILNDAQGKIGTILKPEQMKAMYDAGFEWGEYLGVNAPWEQGIAAPPPPKK